jgi:hypothetical protein
MNTEQAHLRSRMRALAACATACLLLLQAFTFSCHTAPKLHDGATVSAAAQTEATPCHEGKDSRSPAQVSHDCCSHCTAAGRDAATQFLAAVAGFILQPTPNVTAAAYYRTPVRNPVLLGLMTSWSSRAPPRIG